MTIRWLTGTRAAFLAGAAGAVLAGGNASAQTAEATPVAEQEAPPEAVQSGVSGDIVVTARRREERLQDVPIAVTAVTGETLAQANIVQLGDLQTKVPGMTMTPSAFGSNILQVAIRGQRQYDPYITKDPAVAVYFADVVQNRPHGLNSSLFDLESIQVLKGPQGTLFGRNTTGGAVIIAPKAPTDRFEGYALASYGNYEAVRLEGAVNIPVNDSLSVRVAGAIARRDGFTRNLTTGQRLDDEHKNSWRVSIRFAPGDVFENRLVVSGFEADENGTGYKFYAYRKGSITDQFVTAIDPGGLDRELALLATLPFHTTLSNEVLSTRIKTFSLSNVSELKAGDDITIKNIFGYRTVHSTTNFDLEGSRYNFFPSFEDMRERQFSNEFQVLGTALGGSLDYIVGAFWFFERGSDRQISDTFTNYAPLKAVRTSFADPITNEAYSVFAQATWRLAFLEGVSVTAGVRQNWDERSVFARSQTNGVCRLVTADVGGTPLNPCAKQLSATFDNLTYTGTIDWKVTPDVLLYLSHRKGYRTGGFNFGGGRPSELLPFRPEEVKDFELGFKSKFNFAGARGIFNVAAYSQDYKDIQRTIGFFVPNTTPPVFVNSILNAAAATIRGVEADLTFEPVRNFEIGGNVSYIDARYKGFVDQATGADLSGSAFAGTPEWAMGGFAALTLPLPGDGGEVLIRGDVYHQTTSNYADANYDPSIRAPSLASRIPPYTVVNGRIEWRNAFGKPVSLALFGRNLLNEEYIVGGTDITLNVGYAGVILGAPRTYGIEAKFSF
ncbi:TonB-dependent receptor [Sphingomonas turrisvirgatae]|uniref:TonB-dependent receptor n=1 Tax=Sphingomonas turrisvirgatae TaxID=1888892 RepID=UPI0009A15C40|nr:TonB-dependent receptor [Sphingomonas turrisvirgatae]